ncbi:hypothetical protein ACBY01_15645 [Sphingomonas sp. ac-8]|uniref:hypothetical protein n=1 Tax=Sphingomonas sp. ac-8 TaxID=3242977 RepID=UPI003A80566F
MNRPFLSVTLAGAMALGGGTAVHAQADGRTAPEEPGADPALVPATLSDALSCKSHVAALAFGYALFLEGKTPKWMSRITDKDKNVGGMIGLYGYRLQKPVTLFEETVDRIYFMKDWVVTLWPRARAEAFIREQKLARAPIRMTQQYYRFLDPESGPMLGVFEPTGGAIASLLARSLGAEAEAPPPSDVLFVGCNYAPVTQREFLEAAGHADAMADRAARNVGEMMKPGDQHPD